MNRKKKLVESIVNFVDEYLEMIILVVLVIGLPTVWPTIFYYFFR